MTVIQPDDITVAIFCALPEEAVAVKLVFDEQFECAITPPGHQLYVYTYGRIGDHRIVLTLPHQMGTVKASQCAAVATQQFLNIRFALLIGIGGGIPSSNVDIRLGDIAVSIPQDNHPGVIEYDYGKYARNGQFILKGTLDKPAPILLSADMSIQMDELEGEFAIDEMIERITRKPRFCRPTRDVLFADTFHHVGGNDCSACDESSQKHIVERERRKRDVIVHRGLILSGGGVIKCPEDRDRLRRGNEQAICYEMEAAGIMDQIPCLVIRGICDYADTHKNDDWHYYAAAVAAAYGGAILMKIRGEQVRQTTSMREVMDGVRRIESRFDEARSEADRQHILDWIGQKNWQHAQHEHFTKHQPETGRWFLNHLTFRKWVAGDQQTLLCQGDPGVGKTVMASVMIQHLKSQVCIQPETNTSKTSATAFFYFNSEERGKQLPTSVMWSILRQLVESYPGSTPKSVQGLFNKHKLEGTGKLKMNEITSAVCDVSLSFADVFIVIDALDEGEEGGLKKELLPELFEVQRRTKANIVATSRQLHWIRNSFEKLAPGHMLLPIRAADEDVERYVEERIKHHEVIQTFNSPARKGDLEKEIREGIINAAKGIFLLVRFYMDEVMYQISENGIKTAISKLPEVSKAYQEMYEKTITRIHDQHPQARSLACKTLKWVVCARRPLTVSELGEAVAVKISSSKLDDKDKSPVRLILEACKGLVTVADDQTVRLLHHTAREYFDHNLERLMDLGNPNLSRELNGVVATNEQQTSPRMLVHADLVLVCITYISFNAFAYGPCQIRSEVEERLEENQFYQYASSEWLYHLERTESEVLRIMNSACMVKLLNSSSKYLASGQILFRSSLIRNIWGPWGFDQFPNVGITLLHLAAFSGSDQMVIFLLLLDSNQAHKKDSNGVTPLIYAATNGQSSTVQLLIEAGAMVDACDKFHRTPLYLAVYEGHEDIVKQLLDHGANIEGIHQCKDTPLLRSIGRRRLNITKLLVERGANVNARACDGETALTYALKRGYEATARLLIKKGADIHAANSQNDTPLSLAVWRGYTDICDDLLQQGASIHDNGNGRLLLCAAARNGYLDICRRLVEGKVPVDGYKDTTSPLSEAARIGRLDICRFLLYNGARVDGNVSTSCPLSEAVGGGHLETCRLLLANKACADGQPRQAIPLAIAAYEGHLEICRLLLDENAQVNGRGGITTPLLWASMRGFSDIVRLLLDHGADTRNSKALIEASSKGHYSIVRMLLSTGAGLEEDARSALVNCADCPHRKEIMDILSLYILSPERFLPGRCKD